LNEVTKSGLEEYRQKRDLKRTSEPAGVKKQGKGPLTFVVHKHHARQLHYDFRLELDGLLKSWAIPKGPSLDPSVKRLAVNVEDHPLDYATFEGTIPKGEYGAGEVIIWDSGTYSPDYGGNLLFDDRVQAEKDMREGFKKGKLSIFLRGNKLRGSFSLVKMQHDKNNWLFMKHRDEYAIGDKDFTQEEPVIDNSGPEISSSKNDPPPLKPADVKGARAASIPRKITPMLATLVDAPFSSPDWIFEPKLDGYRILVRIQNGKVVLLSRNGNDVTETYNALVPDLSKQPASEMLLDGEMIATDDKGNPCFQCLQDYQQAMHSQIASASKKLYPLIYYVFDLLYLDGFDLRDVALRERKGLLRGTLHTTGQVRMVEYFETDGETVYKAAIKSGLEGVVAKQLDSKYESKRSQSWLKIKAMKTDEFVIGGFTTGEGNRAQTFGALLLGQYNKKGGLIYTGHVGSGFDEQKLIILRKTLDSLKTTKMPFDEKPPLNATTTWVKPQLVAEVKFSEWTKDNILRTPIFLRLREDKSPQEVQRAETIKTSRLFKKPAHSLDLSGDITAPDPAPSEILQQLNNRDNNITIEVDAQKIKLTNLDKELWPGTKNHPPLAKRDFIKYLAEVAPYILLHLKDRPITLSRYPNGVTGQHFWQKHWPFSLPDFVERVRITSKEDGSVGEYMLCNNMATLLWLGQGANIEFHSWFSRTTPEDSPKLKHTRTLDELLEYPDFIIFDLDPYLYSGKEKSGDEPELNRKGFERVSEVALWLKEILDSLSLNAFIKTSGKTGLHIYVPIVRNLEYKAVRSAAQTIGQALVEKHPTAVTMDWAVEKRTGKVFFDYNQNVRGKTLACAYSPRPNPEASVSTPLRWEELGKVYPTDFSIMTMPSRLKKTGDLWAKILDNKGNIESILNKK
jgi:bifunctional non-homologous end joining protein LigD